MDREILNTLTKINILDSLEKVKKKEEEFITLVKALSLMDCGKMMKKQKELWLYLTEMLFEGFLKTISDMREFTIIKMETFTKGFGQMIWKMEVANLFSKMANLMRVSFLMAKSMAMGRINGQPEIFSVANFVKISEKVWEYTSGQREATIKENGKQTAWMVLVG